MDYLLDPHNNPMRPVLELASFYTCGDWSLKKWSHLANMIHIMNVWWIWDSDTHFLTWSPWNQILNLSHCSSQDILPQKYFSNLHPNLRVKRPSSSHYPTTTSTFPSTQCWKYFLNIPLIFAFASTPSTLKEINSPLSLSQICIQPFSY